MSGSPAKFAAKRRLLSASRSKWICSSTASQKLRIAPSSEISRKDGTARSRSRATKSRMERSRRTFSRMSGRRTFTATTSPVRRSTARCTCATEAAATGVGSKASKISSSGAPRPDSTVQRTAAKEKGGTWSCSTEISSTSGRGSRSPRVEAICPTLMKVAPSDVHSRTRARPAARASGADPRPRSRHHWRANTQAATAVAPAMCAERTPILPACPSPLFIPETHPAAPGFVGRGSG